MDFIDFVNYVEHQMRYSPRYSPIPKSISDISLEQYTFNIVWAKGTDIDGAGLAFALEDIIDSYDGDLPVVDFVVSIDNHADRTCGFVEIEWEGLS